MRVLFVGFVWPETKSSAAGQNIISYIDACVDQGWPTWFCSAAQMGEQSDDLNERGAQVFECRLNCSSFDQQVQEIAPDIVIFDRFLSFEQFSARVKSCCPQALLVIDAEDLHFLRQARLLHLKQARDASAFINHQAILETPQQALLQNEIALRELSCIYQADLSLVLSSFESQLLRTQFSVPAHQVSHTPFVLCQSNIEPLSYAEKQDFVLIGNFRHAPNYHAAKVLRENIWPQVYSLLKKHLPSISCHVYGAYMSPKAKQLENKSINFYMHGFANNQFEVINRARVMLAPINFGAGVKGKLLDAMRCNTPSVTTTIGAEGITDLPWPGIVSDSINEFKTAATELYLNPDLWQGAVDRGRAILHQDYNASKGRKKFIDTLAEAYSKLNQRRSSNFLQRLLNQQQFLASKYMSQWIEAKNKPK